MLQKNDAFGLGEEERNLCLVPVQEQGAEASRCPLLCSDTEALKVLEPWGVRAGGAQPWGAGHGPSAAQVLGGNLTRTQPSSCLPLCVT